MQGVGQKKPKVVLIGSASVGKTSLINRIIENKFEPMTSPTTGTAFFEYTPKNPDRPAIEIWDTAGMERYRAVNVVFYREAVGAILVFDLTSYQSFKDLEGWHNEFVSMSPQNPQIVLVGNKCDCTDEFEVDNDEIQAFANDKHINYYATSALSGEGVDEMLDALLAMIPKENACVVTTIVEADPPGKKCC